MRTMKTWQNFAGDAGTATTRWNKREGVVGGVQVTSRPRKRNSKSGVRKKAEGGIGVRPEGDGARQ
jgi:hypothetical protein